MIKKFNEFINESKYHNLELILEDHRFDTNPGVDFGEEWEKLDSSDDVYKYIQSKLPVYKGVKNDFQPGVSDVFRVPEHYDGAEETTGYHYVAYIHGGENGSGTWDRYFDYLKELFVNTDDAWVMDLINDCSDDVWDLRLCFKIKGDE